MQEKYECLFMVVLESCTEVCCIAAHSAGSVRLQVACHGLVMSESCQFEYRTRQRDTRSDYMSQSGIELGR